MVDREDRSLREIVGAVAAGRMTAVELMEAARERHEALNEDLGAYCAWDAEAALEEARLADGVRLRFGVRGPLHGIPVSLKDHFGVRQFPTWAGTSRELPKRWRREGPVVQELRRQLAILPGKTVAVELAFGGIGINSTFGSPRNPWDSEVDRVAGGSSSGAGVSLQEGSALLALGTDTAGSCRIPAAMTGVVGLKTTRGRWSTNGVVPLSSSLDTVGLLARSVEDAIYGFAALDPTTELGPRDLVERLTGAADPRRLRIGVIHEQLWDDCSPGVAEAVQEALAELEQAGASITSVTVAEAREAEALLRCGSVVSAELDELLEAELPAWRERIDPIVATRIADGGGITAREYLARQRRIRTASQAIVCKFSGLDALACPTVPRTAPPIEALADLSAYRRENFLSLRNTCLANLLGLSAITIPVALDAAGIPVGLQLLGQGGGDIGLLRTAAAVERQLGAPQDRLGIPPRCPLGKKRGKTEES